MKTDNAKLSDVMYAVRTLERGIELKVAELEAFLLNQFPPGTLIQFDHHGYLQTGEVIDVWRGEIRVKNVKTGCVRWVTLYDLRERLSKGGGE